jgi:hypothetical protein
MTYNFQSSETALLKRLKNSLAVKQKSGYSREVGAGFVAEDLRDIYQDISGEIIVSTEAFNQRMHIRDINLRETEEAIRFVQIKIATAKLAEVTQDDKPKS